MPVWRCPHCATPQAEASRCWVCRQSTTSCVTCRHYRRGITGGLGLCGLERRHPTVAATDVRPCWVSAPAVADAATADRDALGWLVADAGGRPATTRPPRTFVPIEALAREVARAGVAVMDPDAGEPRPATVAAPPTVPEPVRRVPGRWWLWGDPDPWQER